MTNPIVRDYAPILHFHPKEGNYCCFPTDAEATYLQYRDNWERFKRRLEPKNLDPKCPCYYEIWHDEDMIQIRYWFWYLYNRFPKAPFGLGEHLGDWEHVEVRIYDEKKVIWLLSSHLTARLASPSAKISLEGFVPEEAHLSDRHIHAWVALGSHAHYPSPESKPYCVGRVLCDRVSDAGELWHTQENLVHLMDTEFSKYTGRWGDERAPRSPTNDYNNRWRNALKTKPIDI